MCVTCVIMLPGQSCPYTSEDVGYDVFFHVHGQLVSRSQHFIAKASFSIDTQPKKDSHEHPRFSSTFLFVLGLSVCMQR